MSMVVCEDCPHIVQWKSEIVCFSCFVCFVWAMCNLCPWLSGDCPHIVQWKSAIVCLLSMRCLIHVRGCLWGLSEYCLPKVRNCLYLVWFVYAMSSTCPCPKICVNIEPTSLKWEKHCFISALHQYVTQIKRNQKHNHFNMECCDESLHYFSKK